MNSKQALEEKNTQSEHGNGNAENTNSSNYSSEQTEMFSVENTPFAVVRLEKEWFVMMGNYRLTQGLGSKEEAMEDAKREDWIRIMQVIEVTVNLLKDK